MLLKIGQFELDVMHGPGWLFVRIPWVGQAFVGGGRVTFDTWATLKAVGEVR